MIFKGLSSVAKTCLRPERVPLKQFLMLLDNPCILKQHLIVSEHASKQSNVIRTFK